MSLAPWAAFALLKARQPDEGGGAIRWALSPRPSPLVVMMGVGSRILVAPSSRATVWLATRRRAAWCRSFSSAPVFLGLVWSFRRLAPTRLRLAGFAVGMLSGATSATVYALSCMAFTAFLATWYVLGILAAGMIGALTGPRPCAGEPLRGPWLTSRSSGSAFG